MSVFTSQGSNEIVTKKIVKPPTLRRDGELNAVEKDKLVNKDAKLQESISSLENIVHITPDDIDSLQKLSKLLVKDKQYNRSIDIFNRILEIDPLVTSILPHYIKALRNIEGRDKANAIIERHLKNIIQLNKNDTNLLAKYAHRYAHVFMSLGNRVKANELFNYALRISPSNNDIASDFIKALLKSMDVEEKIDFLFKIIDSIREKNIQQLVLTSNNENDNQNILNILCREIGIEKDVRKTKLKGLSPLSLIVKDIIKTLVNFREYNNSLLILIKYFQINSDSFNILVSYINMLKQVKEYSVLRQIIEKTSLDTPEKISLVCFVTKSLPKNDSFYQAGLLKIETSLRAYLYDLGLIDDYDMRFDISEFIRDRPNYLIRKIKSFFRNHSEEKSVEVWKFLFYLNPLNDQVISECTNNLMQHNCIEDTFKIYDISLELLPENINILTRYANFLFRQDHYEFSFDLYECALKLEPNNLITLNSYANALAKQGNCAKALELLSFSLELDDRDVRTLTSYANTLFKVGEYERSLHILEINLQLEPYNTITLTNYANTLVKLEKFQEAFAIFEKVTHENPYDIYALRAYAKSLADYGNVDRASQFFEIALSINNTDSRTLNDYSSLLIQHEKWSVLAKINPRKPYFLLKYAQYLEREGNYESALSQLLDIDLATQKTYHANIIRLNLGRLYYQLGQIDLGKQFFEEAIANSEDQDKSTLYAARSLLASSPNSQEAINLLRQIQEDSPRYAEAMKAIALNADEETSYELFGADEEQIDDIEMLYRAMYHKIGN